MIVRSPRSVRLPVEVRLLPPGGGAIAVEAELRYDSRDPYAVTVSFRTGAQRAARACDGVPDEGDPLMVVAWTFARQLLTDGIGRACGAGDVRVWPSVDRASTVLWLSLSAPSGAAQFGFPLRVVVEFLTSTYDIVPFGCERDFWDIDATLAALLSGVGEN